MTTYNIKNQEDFNKAYSSASVKERGKLGYAFPEYYTNYIKGNTDTYSQWIGKIKAGVQERRDKAEQEINQALRKDLNEEHLKAISGRENKYWKPITSQEQRDKYANYLKQQKAQPKKTNLSKDDIKLLIANEARKQGVDPKLALAIAQHESGFNPNARGDGGKSYGLFQIYTTAHPDYKGGFDPQKNAEYGIRFIKNLLNKYGGDVYKALRAYNGGSGGLNLPQTARYADTVMGIYKNIKDVEDLPTPVPTSQVSSRPTEQPSYQPKIDLKEFGGMLDDIYSSQNAQEGALNNFQDNLYLKQIQPGLTGQRMAQEIISNNPSSQYLDIAKQGYQNTYDLARQAGGYGLQPVQQEGKEDMMNYNNGMAPVPNPQDYSMALGEMRPYAQIDNQPQNIREDVLADYLNLINNLRLQNAGQNDVMMKQMQKAEQADRLQNTANMIANIASNEPVKAPNTWVTPWGMVTQQYDQSRPLNLPTNTSSNMDAFKNQLALQLKGQQSNKDMIDAFKSAISAQEMSNVTGLPSGVFLDPDLYKAYAQYIQSPEIAEGAKFKREAGMAPINLSSDLSKQSLVNAGNLDVANVNALANLNKTGLQGEYQLKNTALQNTMSGANQYRNALLGAQSQMAMNKANNMAKVAIAQMDNETKLEVARQAGANAQQLAMLQDSLYSNNPVRVQNANAQLTNAMANLMLLNDNPEQGFELYNRIINMGNPDNQTGGDDLSLGVWND